MTDPDNGETPGLPKCPYCNGTDPNCDYSTSEYEGFYCVICGDESGNTDWCVSCAVKAHEWETWAAW